MATPALKRWAAIFGIWTALGALLTVQTISAWPFPIPEHDVAWHYTLTAIMQMGRAWLWAACTPLVFELRRRIPMRGLMLPLGLSLHLACAAGLALTILVLRVWYVYIVKQEPWEAFYLQNLIPTWFNARQITDLFIYAGIVLMGFLLDLWRERIDLLRNEARLLNVQHELQLNREQLAKQLVQAELAALRQRLNPHFMFNAMNSVAVLVRKRETDRAVEAISLLSALLRTVLGTDAHQLQVTLEQELDYVRSYLTLEQIRYGDRLQVEWQVEKEVLAALVPTFLLQPIIENAIKHGTSRRASDGWVRVTARRDGRFLRLEVFNDPAEAEAPVAPKPEGYGVGQSSTLRRLETAFGGDYEFSRRSDEHGTTVMIAFPLSGIPPANPSSRHHEKIQDAHC